MMSTKNLFICVLFVLAVSYVAPPKKTKLFLPGKTKEWHLFAPGKTASDVFQFEGEVLHVSGEVTGYIITEAKYKDFHFSVEFKWGDKRYAPRENEKRDAGIMYHCDLYNGDKIWPRSLEYQIQQTDVGDFWMIDSAIIRRNDTLSKPGNWIRMAKLKDAEKPKGEWNKAEVIVKNGKISHLLNGVEVNHGELVNTKEGSILLQSEFAEIYYRNAEVEEL